MTVVQMTAIFSIFTPCSTGVYKHRKSSVRATTYCTAAPNIGGSSVWNLLRAIQLSSWILIWLLDCYKMCTPLVQCTCFFCGVSEYYKSRKGNSHLNTRAVKSPNVAVRVLALLLCTYGVPQSNLSSVSESVEVRSSRRFS